MLGEQARERASAAIDVAVEASVDAEVAFAAFAARKLDTSYRIASLIVGHADAEDVTHDAFVAAWRGWSTVRDPDRRDAWFGRILVNRCRDALRRQRRRPVVDISDAIGSLATTADVSSEAIDRDAIARAFARLRPDQRIVVVLRYYGDLTVPQIAAQTGLPEGTVKSRLHTSLRAMRVEIDPRPGEDDR